MSSSGTARYPLCQHFTETYEPLAKADERGSDFERRFNSISAFLIGKADGFLKSLRDRQRAMLGMDDLMTDLWVELRIKDDKWRPDEGKYITFAGTIAEHLFVAIRDQTNTVQSPRNTGSRLRDYEAEREAGTLSRRKSATADKIRRSRGDYGDVDDQPFVTHDDPGEEAAAAERSKVVTDAIVKGLSSLTPYEAVVVGARAGLWGQAVLSVDEIAERKGLAANRVRTLLASARRKIRTALEDDETVGGD